MIVVGVLLVLLAALFVVGFVLASGGSTEAEFYGLILPNLSARTLVLLGLTLGLALALGFGIVRGRIARWSRRRKARRAAAESLVGGDGLAGEPAESYPTQSPAPEAR
jgi:hypothetical protein